ELGGGAPSVLLRQVTAIEGAVELELEYAPRPEYGLIYPLIMHVARGVRAQGGADVLALSSPVPLDREDYGARARFTVEPGTTISFALAHATTSQRRPRFWTPEEIENRLDDTLTAWRTWSALHQNYDGPWRDLVALSGRVLYALTYFPTGAICAAATTSLPEVAGGERNWDYRYAWVRDASFTLQALWAPARPDQANTVSTFLTHGPASQVRRGQDLQLMFGIGGERDLTDRALPHLRGWRDSAPVRVGNGAWTQRQLDVYGEMLDAAHRLPDQLRRLS